MGYSYRYDYLDRLAYFILCLKTVASLSHLYRDTKANNCLLKNNYTELDRTSWNYSMKYYKTVNYKFHGVSVYVVL